MTLTLLAADVAHAAAGSELSLWSVDAGVALLTLTALEIVLGIDNIIFIAILCGRLPEHQRKKARLLGLGLAMGMRILLLLGINWVMGLTKELFTMLGHGVTGKDLVLLIGGMFLIAKATFEIHHKVEDASHDASVVKKMASFGTVIAQIIMLDIVFSLDSVITAVGMAKHIEVMVAAVVIAVVVMMAFAGTVSRFIDKHPTFKMLALAFLVLIGVMLVADGMGHHIPKGYIYSAMLFSLLVEALNTWVRSKQSTTASVISGSNLPPGPGSSHRPH